MFEEVRFACLFFRFLGGVEKLTDIFILHPFPISWVSRRLHHRDTEDTEPIDDLRNLNVVKVPVKCKISLKIVQI